MSTPRITQQQIQEIEADHVSSPSFGPHEKKLQAQRSMLLAYIAQQFQERLEVDARIAELEKALRMEQDMRVIESTVDTDERMERLEVANTILRDLLSRVASILSGSHPRHCGIHMIHSVQIGVEFAQEIFSALASTDAADGQRQHPDTARLDKLPQCFHMLRCSFAADRSQHWWLTYDTNNVYDTVREAIDAHQQPGEQL